MHLSSSPDQNNLSQVLLTTSGKHNFLHFHFILLFNLYTLLAWKLIILPYFTLNDLKFSTFEIYNVIFIAPKSAGSRKKLIFFYRVSQKRGSRKVIYFSCILKRDEDIKYKENFDLLKKLKFAQILQSQSILKEHKW